MDPLASIIDGHGSIIVGHGVVSSVGVQVVVVLVSLVVDRYVVVVGGDVAGGGSSHLSQMKNPILLFGPSVGSFLYEKISSVAPFSLIQSSLSLC